MTPYELDLYELGFFAAAGLSIEARCGADAIAVRCAPGDVTATTPAFWNAAIATYFLGEGIV